MADLVITASSVSGTTGGTGTAGEAITAGDVLALSGGSLVLADANGGTGAANALRKPVGIALNDAAAGQPVAYATPGSMVTLGAVLTAGTAYYLSGTPGGIAPVADVAAGMTPIVVGIAFSTSQLKISMLSSGVEI
ncbi:hypothetical protein GCM10011348_45830 [Marinobacterium nitratireducens]|uniref:Uncharacterized protein n=1 Tax=Marinobacterium nitratireducens TaxID=518897 RepID=A0A918DYJ9_9GAMM|nr:hypothetical protein [Marinobacterium nitratireducens]GGO89031.1 hypothetical protein GCM10011348_45830 [Marinobacterium nitratireducens]